ncbi:hypothetical protein [Haematobacter missouriensis]|uniref:hypothetical protein n=1 Tax=Haematobacter missouriensis TaxID=366616 RepID=UPI003D15BAAC
MLVETALREGVPGSVQSMRMEQRRGLGRAPSTSPVLLRRNCREGSRHIRGNSLIKQAAQEL